MCNYHCCPCLFVFFFIRKQKMYPCKSKNNRYANFVISLWFPSKKEIQTLINKKTKNKNMTTDFRFYRYKIKLQKTKLKIIFMCECFPLLRKKKITTPIISKTLYKNTWYFLFFRLEQGYLVELFTYGNWGKKR